MNLVKCGVTRDGLREQVTPPSIQRPCSASCKALKKAISSLHRVDDFDHEYIGSGFFSDIYKVVHKVTRQVMVLKKNVKTINRSNVRREIQLMNKLSHPNILRFYGVCVIEGHMHALVEYINGGSLEQLLADKSVELPWMQRIHLACDIAKGIKYLHSKGYMHRDLTSKNILIKKYTDGRTAAVVADLGLADRIPDPEKQVASVGSPYWMAPECISGKKYTEKADVFSYGIVLCEIIARVEADPDILPRTKKFGVDYVEFSKMSADCPLHLLHQAFICCQIEPSKRPCFQRIVLNLQEMKSSAQMAVILADLSRLGIVNSGKNVLNRMLLEKILDEKLKQRKRTADDVQHSLNQTPPPYAPSTGNLHQVHSPSNNEASDQTIRSTINFVPVTPMIVGKVMSRDDVYYAPQQGNPFPVRLRSAKWVEKSKESWKSSLCTSDDGNETDRGILEDCTDFLELHSPQERHARSCQQSMSHSRHLPLTCFPSMVLPEFISTPSSTSSTFSRLNRRLQRSNSMPGSPSSLFENDEQKDSFATSSQVTSNSFSSDKLKNNFGDFSSANTSFSLCSTETLSCFQSNTIAPHTVEQTSDASEYGSSSMDSALGSEVARVRPRRSCVIPSGARKESVTPKAIQRHNRVCSATVYRSSSTVYPQFEEAAILAKYFEICRSDSFNSSQNSSSPFCSTGYDHSDDNECLATNSIYRRSPSPTMHSSKESNLVTSSSGIDSDAPWEDQDQSLSEEPNLGKRDDPNRKSRERFLQLVKNWENNSSNNSVDKISSQPVENVSKDSVALRPGGQARLMEFAEFYLLRRFQELKQKWERRQQGQTSSKVAKSSKIRDGDETIRNSPEKFEEVLLTT